MKLPRDLNGVALVKALRVLGYEPTRQHGSHIRVTTQMDGENHEVIPHHQPLDLEIHPSGPKGPVILRLLRHD
jgi:predicted RNA binding protein YcfA (HicA-like mRNA interferase family)